MSDEYANSGFKNSLLNSSMHPLHSRLAAIDLQCILSPAAPDTDPRSSKTSTSDYTTGNYPPSDDTTSSGGFRSGASTQPNLVDESPTASGVNTHAEDISPRHEDGKNAGRDAYDAGSMESRAQAETELAARYQEGRKRSGSQTGRSEYVDISPLVPPLGNCTKYPELRAYERTLTAMGSQRA
ncbi:hypothetical protein OF83DRAFT_1086355 [Amylostereum chailletii]|nr:hypothetical protein OF83DRAFT_1086355 [Amylostereum chailletii]